MKLPEEFRKNAVICKRTAMIAYDPVSKAVWQRMAERWLVCADLAEQEQSAVQLRAERERSKPTKKQARRWAH